MTKHKLLIYDKVLRLLKWALKQIIEKMNGM